ncbi:hypothetical protein AB4Y45_35725 [Paraburkholderia sp. EG287A]|uniref:hypothetical protein n=1 Tax=Paraburkholderia sp. EG287A TaxID=3237012 RepID=UPI0034D192D4
MALFRTEDVVAFARSLEHVSNVEVLCAGGDVDTKCVKVHVGPSGNCFFIAGFSTGEPCLVDVFGPDPDNCDVEMVEIKDGKSSAGGWTSNRVDDGAVYVALTTWLRVQGHEVVASMDGYF